MLKAKKEEPRRLSLFEREAISSGFERRVKNLYFTVGVNDSDLQGVPSYPLSSTEVRRIIMSKQK